MHAMMALTLGIEELHRRNTSGVHAARSCAVPNALLGVEYISEPDTSIKAPVRIAALFMTSPHLLQSIEATRKSLADQRRALKRAAESRELGSPLKHLAPAPATRKIPIISQRHARWRRHIAGLALFRA